MTIDNMREFLELARELNYRVAAENLFITQPALSRHIAQMEEEINIELFERTTQSVKLTQAGELFQRRCSQIVREYDDLRSMLRLMKNNFNNRLRIGVPYYAIRDYLGAVPETFERTYPDIKLLYSVGDPYQVTELLNSDQIDVAIIPKLSLPTQKEFEFNSLYEEPVGVLMNSGNPLARKETLRLADLKKELFFTVNNQYFSKTWNYTKNLCKHAGFVPHEPAVFNQMEALLMAIRRGDGITIIGRHMRNQQMELIVYRPLTDPECHRTVCLCYKKGNRNSAIAKFRKIYNSVHTIDS